MLNKQFAKRAFKQVTSGFLTTAIALGVCLSPTVALASSFTPTAVPTTVALGLSNLYITLSGVGYEAYTSGQPGGCPAVSADTLKLWTSFAQSAVLSGKTIQMRYTDCGGLHLIDTIDLNH
jgi:hypothetical protein